jgi:hypothetical protein
MTELWETSVGHGELFYRTRRSRRSAQSPNTLQFGEGLFFQKNIGKVA